MSSDRNILERELGKLNDRIGDTLPGSKEEKEIQKQIEWIQSLILKTEKYPIQDELRVRCKQLLFEQLLRCNFRQQIRLVNQVIDQYRSAAFLIHGLPDYGQRMLAYRLARLKLEWETGQHISIDAGSRGIGKSSRALWEQVAKRLQLPSGKDRETIASRVGVWLQTQDVIFTLHSVDYIPSNVLSTWLKEFWVPLVTITRKAQCQSRSQRHLLLFLVDYVGNICDLKGYWIKQPDDLSEAFMPLLLPKIGPFTEYDIESLIDDITEILPSYLSVKTLLDETNNGIPELLYEKVCEHCGFSIWEVIPPSCG